MNASFIEGGKVHRLRDTGARCGVGKPVQRGHWQMELGEVTCQRCGRLLRMDRAAQQLEIAKPTTTTEQPAKPNNHEPTHVGGYEK